MTTSTPTTEQAAVNVFTITDPAAVKLAEILATEASSTMRLRVAVRPGGCSGFSYEMYFDDEIIDSDVLFERSLAGSTIPVVVDQASASLIKDAVLDYSDGLSGSGFKFTNPNATRTCGCGQSFS
jgi:iron-sulfur cluster assembly accessory protein